MTVIRSALLEAHGIVHAFSTRVGGVSPLPYASLNLGDGVGDDTDHVRENIEIFCRALGIERAQLYTQSQVHGDRVRELGAEDAPKKVALNKGDALITRTAGVGVAIRTADCVPILIAHPLSGAVCAVHAGWRGAVAGIASKAIHALGVQPEGLLCAIGPHIHAPSFEIGHEVAEQMQDAALGDERVVNLDGAKPHGNLGRLLQLQLRAAGVLSEHIDDVGECTFENEALFYSHRRDHGHTGRHLSAIVAGLKGGE